MRDEIKNRYSFHKPDRLAIEAMRAIRRRIRELANAIDELCPEGREKENALTELQAVMMHANSAICQQFPVDEQDV